MNARFAVPLFGLLAMLMAAPAFAGRGGPGGGPGGGRFGESGVMPAFSGPDFERPLRAQDFRREDAPPTGRMSPEERRQLRRDIRHAGEDIYRRPPAEGMPPRR